MALRERLRSSGAVNHLVHRATKSLGGISRDEDVFTEEYFRMVEQTTSQSASVIAGSIVQDLKPKRVVDVGCGTGVLLERLRDHGVEVMGLEYNEIALRICTGRSLDARRFDIEHDPIISFAEAEVAVCFEVGNLIAESAADRCVEILSSVSRAVVFSAGAPGQGGVHVRNEQPQEYWIAKFQARGFAFDSELSQKWRSHWKARNIAPWFSKNVIVLKRRQRI
ncbi:MAG: hypothetical protein HW412_690 [Bacteroidetes bacterium]|nr:hypothetical protein [Bacteroidota bacterium]